MSARSIFSGFAKYCQHLVRHRRHRDSLTSNLCRTAYSSISIKRVAMIGALSFSVLHWPAFAIELGDGDVEANLDITLTYGVTSRISKRDEGLTGPNSNDGDLNYDRGIVSNTAGITTELEVHGNNNMGVFMRTHGFVDFENKDGERVRTPLSDEAQGIVGKDFKLLDAYVYAGFDVMGCPVDLRIGNQVLNWGESTFIQNGINVINPFDVGRLRTPGSELRDALVPVPMISASFDVAPNVSMEGFYQVEWKKTVIDPKGSYFSTTDYVSPGGDYAFITINDDVTDDGSRLIDSLAGALNADFFGDSTKNRTGISLQPSHDPYYLGVMRTSDRTAKDGDQWGLALRYFAEQLNNTEFGVFFVKNHSRLPVVSGIAPSKMEYENVLGMSAGLTELLVGNEFPANFGGQLGSLINSTGSLNQFQAALGDAKTISALATAVALSQGRLQPTEHFDQNGLNPKGVAVLQNLVQYPEFRFALATGAGGIAQLLTIDRYAKASNYIAEYPEDVKTIGLSFNTALPESGWAIQGEYSYHADVALQREEGSIFAQALAPLFCAPNCPPQVTAILGQGNKPGYLRGYVRRDVSQLQVTGTKLIGSALGSDSTGFIAEFGVNHVHNMPDSSITPLETGGALDGDVADATSYGYRGAIWFDYNNAIGAARLTPYFQFQHDVNGTTPAPGGAFLEGRKVYTLGLGINYLERWSADISVTAHSGSRNYLSDRDFFQASLSYSF